MAANQKDRKDLDVLKPGTSRSLVLAEFGMPAAAEVRGGKKVDVFTFTQGQAEAFNMGRAVGHGVADIATLGLWEVVGTPTEMALKGKKVAFEITYDSSERVQQAVRLYEK